MPTSERIYLDYASATPVLPEALTAMQEALTLHGNPGAIHADGVAAKHALEQARGNIALELGCKSREIIFTSGGTEANNLAILGFARALQLRPGHKSDVCPPLVGTHWIVSAIEHPSVLECFVEIERLGGEVTHVDPDERGIITSEHLTRALRPTTVMVSIGWGNSEIGIVQPLAQIARAIRAFEKEHYTASKKSGASLPTSRAWSHIVFHTDAGQTPLYKHPQVHTLGVDLMTLDSGKLYGPRGVGALYVGKDAEKNGDLAPIIFGGSQERGLRAGTENVALAAGFAAAFAHVSSEREEESKRLQKLRDDFARDVVARIPSTVVNGALEHSMPHILNISIPDIESEYLTLALDTRGISISTKSACREGEASRSHVVATLSADRQGLGDDTWRSRNTLRFSLGRDTTEGALASTADALASCVRG